MYSRYSGRNGSRSQSFRACRGSCRSRRSRCDISSADRISGTGFYTNCHEANLRALKKHIGKAKEQAKDGLVGVNIMVATREYAAQVRASCEAGADLIISGAGLPAELPELVKGYEEQT